MEIKTLGIDLAKNVFQLHGVDKTGRTITCKRMARAKISEFILDNQVFQISQTILASYLFRHCQYSDQHPSYV